MIPANKNTDAVFILCDNSDWHIGSELDLSLRMSAIRTFSQRDDRFWMRTKRQIISKIQKSTAAVVVVSDALIQNIKDHQIYLDAIIKKFGKDVNKQKRIVCFNLDDSETRPIVGLETSKHIDFDVNGETHLHEIYFYLREVGIRPLNKDNDKTSGVVPWEPTKETLPTCSGVLFLEDECDLYIRGRSLDITLYHAIKVSDAISHFEYHAEARQIAVICDTGVSLDLGVLVQPDQEVIWNCAREVKLIRTSNGEAVEGFSRPLYKIGKPSRKVAMLMHIMAEATKYKY